MCTVDKISGLGGKNTVSFGLGKLHIEQVLVLPRTFGLLQ